MKQRGNRISYDLRQGCEDMADRDSKRTYLRGCICFCEWLETAHGIKYTGHLSRAFPGKLEAVGAFLAALVSGEITTRGGKRYAAATISTYTKGVCHAWNVDYKAVNSGGICPKRTAGRISKGTDQDQAVNPQGRHQETQERFRRFVLLSQVTGARRAELEKIRGRDLVRDESGHLCVLVERGKGGKRQLQRVMPWEEAAVRELFAGKKPKEFILDKSETVNKIDCHHIRAVRSQKCYDHYAALVSSGGADQLRAELVRRWDADHITGHAAQDEAARRAFLAELSNSKPYKLRGENREAAARRGRPLEYCRLAMMAVSVFCLSHWRLDVTAVNYLSK